MQAVIQNKDNTLLLDIPYRRTEIYEKLGSIGIWNPQGDIFIRDNEDEDIRVKLSGSNDFDNHLLGFFDESTTLATVNNVCEAVYTLTPTQRELLENGMKQDQYSDVRALIGAALTLKTQKPERLNINYYCPLEINVPDDDGYEMCEYGGSISKATMNAIKALLFNEQNYGDPMTEYFREDDALKAKLKSAIWDVTKKDGELYGVIRCRFNAPLTASEEEMWRDWIVGQSSDGIGESLEQRPVECEDEELYISFWNSSDSWSLMDEDEFESYLLQEQNGGMQL